MTFCLEISSQGNIAETQLGSKNMDFHISNILFIWKGNFGYEQKWKHLEIYKNITNFSDFSQTSPRIPRNYAQIPRNSRAISLEIRKI